MNSNIFYSDAIKLAELIRNRAVPPVEVALREDRRPRVSEFVINGQTVPTKHIQSATVPFNVTGLPGFSMRFGTSRDGLPIGVQLVSAWLAESTVLYLASQLEAASPVRELRPM